MTKESETPRFTPGPWRVVSSPFKDGMPYFYIAAGSGLYVYDGSGFRFSGIFGAADAYLIAAAPELDAVAEATLLFHSGAAWTPEVAARWKELTGEDEATTRVLCDFARHVRALARGPDRGE